MKAVYITALGGPDVLSVRELPDPKPGPGQVRVRVRAAGVNFADILMRMGLYPGQADWGFRFIQLLERLGLAWDVRTPQTMPARDCLEAA